MKKVVTGILSFFLLLPGMPSLAAQEGKRAHAKSVIEIWMWGGPSQLETFDPKPEASREYNNGLKAIETNVPGIYVSELLPRLAKQADKYSLIRTMTHGNNGHEVATYLMQTGRMPGGRVYPAIGAVIAMFKSKDYKRDLPPYVILTVPKGRFSEIGFLNPKYAPLVTGGNPMAANFVVEGITPPGNLAEEQMKKRFKALDELDTIGNIAGKGKIPAFDQFDKASAEAQEIIFGDEVKVFQLAEESDEMRDLYGRTQLGQSCLLARRLVQAGVPYVTINVQGWDSHKKHFETMAKRTAEMDQAVAALLQDLSDKGLLDTTIVLWTGEFGRKPLIDAAPPWNGGRNHYAACFSAMVAGGGFAGGQVVGVSDEVAGKVVSRPVAPQDLLGSVYELCGIDPDGPLPNDAGLQTTVLPPESKEGRLREIYAGKKNSSVVKQGKESHEKP